MSPLVPVLLGAGAAWMMLGPPGPRRRRRPEPSARSTAPPDWLLPVFAALGAGGAAALFVGGPRGVLLGLGAAVATGAWVRRLETPAARRRRERLERDLPHAVDLLAACLVAGRAPGQAVAEVAAALDGPLHAELSLVGGPAQARRRPGERLAGGRARTRSSAPSAAAWPAWPRPARPSPMRRRGWPRTCAATHAHGWRREPAPSV